MEPEQKSNGALIGSVIIVLILIVGGIYMWQNRPEENTVPLNNSLGSVDGELDLELEANSIDLEGLDSDL
jgi:hypothetical protein